MADIKHRYSGEEGFMEVVDNSRVKHKDYFHIKNLYIMCHEWFIEEGWVKTRSDKTFPEKFYLHRFTQTAGEEVIIWWRFSKDVSKYYRYDWDVNMNVIGLKDVEVMFNNVKFKANTGEIEFDLYSKLIVDPEGKWRKHWLLKHFHNLFWKRMFKNEIVAHKRELLRDNYRFKESLKYYFNLQTYLPEPEGQQFYYTEEFE